MLAVIVWSRASDTPSSSACHPAAAPLRKCSSGSACSSVMPLLYRPLPISITNLPCRFICLYHHHLRQQRMSGLDFHLSAIVKTLSPLTDMQVVWGWQCFSRFTIPSQKSLVRVRSETNNTAAKCKIVHMRHTPDLWKNLILSKSMDGTKTSTFR